MTKIDWLCIALIAAIFAATAYGTRTGPEKQVRVHYSCTVQDVAEINRNYMPISAGIERHCKKGAA